MTSNEGCTHALFLLLVHYRRIYWNIPTLFLPLSPLSAAPNCPKAQTFQSTLTRACHHFAVANHFPHLFSLAIKIDAATTSKSCHSVEAPSPAVTAAPNSSGLCNTFARDLSLTLYTSACYDSLLIFDCLGAWYLPNLATAWTRFRSSDNPKSEMQVTSFLTRSIWCSYEVSWLHCTLRISELGLWWHLTPSLFLWSNLMELFLDHGLAAWRLSGGRWSMAESKGEAVSVLVEETTHRPCRAVRRWSLEYGC